MALVEISGGTGDAGALGDDRPWRLWAAAYQPDGQGGVITTRDDRTSNVLRPVAGVLTFRVEAGITFYLQNPDKRQYLITAPETDATLWETIEASVAYPPDTDAALLAGAVAPYVDEYLPGAVDAVVPDAVDADLTGRNIGFVDEGGGEGYFTVGGAAVSGTLVPPAATWSGVAGIPDLERPIPSGVRLYVEPTGGDDSNSGLTWDKAFATIQAAFTAAPVGAEIMLAPAPHDVGAGASVDASKLLTIRCAKPIRRRQFADSSFANQAFIYSTAATKPDAFINVTNTGTSAFGWMFQSLYIDGNTLAVGGAGIRAVGVNRAIVEDVCGRFVLGGSDTGDDERYLVKSDRGGANDASWWTFRNCITYGIRGAHMTGGNYMTFPGCSFMGLTAGAYKPAGPAVYIQGTQPNLDGLHVEGWEEGIHLDTSRAPIAIGIASESCTTLVRLTDCYDGLVIVNSKAGSGEGAVIDDGGLNNIIIGTDRVYRIGSAVSGIRTSKRGTSPAQLAGGYLGPVYGRHTTIPGAGGELLPHLGMYDAAVSASGVTAEYWDGSAWQTWAADTHPLHLMDLTGVSIDETHKRCRFRLGSFVGGPLPSLLFGRLTQSGGGTLGTVTVTAYTDDARTTVGQTYTSLIGAADVGPSQVRGFLGALEVQNGYWVDIELNLGLTGAQTATLSRLHAWGTEFSGGMRAARILNGRLAPESVVTGRVGDYYIAHGISGSDTTNPGIWRKGSGSSNTGWVRCDLSTGGVQTAHLADASVTGVKLDPAVTAGLAGQAKFMPGTCATAAATTAKTVTLDSPFASHTPVAGDFFLITFTSGSTVGGNLAINGATARTLKTPAGTTTGASLAVGAGLAVLMYFNGTDLIFMGATQNTTYSAATFRTIATLTTSATLGASNDYTTFIGAGGAPTLPTAVGNTGRYVFKNVDASSKNIASTSSQTIDGAAAPLALAAGAAVELVSDGANWRSI